MNYRARFAALVFVLLPALASAAPLQGADAGEESYRYLAGLVERNMLERAVTAGRSFLDEHSGHPRAALARYRLAGALFDLGRLPEAAPHLARLARQDGFEYALEARFRSGQCELAAGRGAQAAQSFEAVLRGAQDYLHEPALFHLAEAHFATREFERATVRYAELLKRFPRSEYAGATERALVWCAWEGGDAAATVRRARAWIAGHSREPGADELRVLLAEALVANGESQAALGVLAEVRDPAQGAAALRGRGFALAAAGDEAGAARAFGELVRRFPDHSLAAEAALQQGVQLLQAGQADAAARALAMAGRSGEVALWRARAERAAGRGARALDLLEGALGDAPSAELRPRLIAERGACLLDLGRTAEGLTVLEDAGTDSALHAACVAALDRGDAESARRLAEAFGRAHPASERLGAVRLVLGEATFRLERYAEAERIFDALLAVATEDDERTRALSRVSWCRYLAGDAASAALGFERLARDYPDALEAEESAALAGRAYSESADTAAAQRCWRRYLATFEHGSRRATVLLELARTEPGADGAALLEELLREHKDSELAPVAGLELAERLVALGDTEGARRRYSALLATDAPPALAARARYGLAYQLHSAGRPQAASPLFAAVAADASAPPELARSARELVVWTHAAAGELDAAVAAWQVLARTEEDDERVFGAARTVLAALRAEGDLARARALADELLRALDDPDVAVRALVEGAFLALDAGDVERAEASVRVARRRAPRDGSVAEAAFFVGEARHRAGDTERALEMYRAAAEVPDQPQAAAVLYKLGFLALEAGDAAAAEAALAALVKDHPRSALRGEGLFLLGEARYRRGRFELAAGDFARLRRELPRHELGTKALFRRGLALARLERWKEAEAALTELAREHGDFENLSESELWRGRACAAGGRARAAREAFARVVKLGPADLAAHARIGMARLLEREGDFEGALSEALKIAILYADEEAVASALLLAGGCLEALEEPERAAEQYRELLARFPKQAVAADARRRLDALANGAPRRL